MKFTPYTLGYRDGRSGTTFGYSSRDLRTEDMDKYTDGYNQGRFDNEMGEYEEEYDE